MDNTNLIKINASVVSCIGSEPVANEDNFYMNGRFMFDHETDNIQVSIDSVKPEFVFSVTDNMDKSIPDKSIPDKSLAISAVKELKRLHDTVLDNKDIASTAKSISDKLDEVNNLLYSVSLGNTEGKAKKASLSCLLLSKGEAIVLNIGSCRAYLFRGEKLKQITSSNKMAERLLKSGIISGEQTAELIKHFDSTGDGINTSVKKSDVIKLETGDIFLLCSNGLIDNIDDDKISKILLSDDSTEKISNSLIREAYKIGKSDNMTALVVRIDNTGRDKLMEIQENEYEEEPRRFASSIARPMMIPPRAANRRKRMIYRIVITIAACFLAVGMTYGGYRLLVNASRADDTGYEFDETGYEETDTNKEEHSNNIETTNDEEESLEPDGENEDKDPDEKDDPVKPVEPDNTDVPAKPDDSKTVNNGVLQPDGSYLYKVQSGDTLQKISLQFYGSRMKYEAIMEANGLTNPNQLKLNQELKIPKTSE